MASGGRYLPYHNKITNKKTIIHIYKRFMENIIHFRLVELNLDPN